MTHQPQFEGAADIGWDIKFLQDAIHSVELFGPEEIYDDLHFHNLVKCSQALEKLISDTVEAVG